MTCKKGDIVLVRFPNSDLKSFKKRPALVVQSNSLALEYKQKLVACITSNLKRNATHRIEVDINTSTGQMTGLKTDSVIITDNMATIQERDVEKVIGSFNDITALDDSLRLVFSL